MKIFITAHSSRRGGGIVVAQSAGKSPSLSSETSAVPVIRRSLILAGTPRF